ncbi:putative membrane protein [Pedobacter sp. AK013]|uniref:bestrophin family protein n=1 Tax=Pedobacter sp. AK013 TaxID=2723071 RepID=UPI0016151F7E|nr:bestrophin family ion channel [Pedobacter sp. AK013]MBB6238808.1 putative membrane protein [Pedobacter sp. AK013]
MIIRKKENWFKMLFVWHGSVLPRLLPRLILLFVLSVGVVFFHGKILSFKVPLNPTPLTLFGFVLALFLGFRNNVSYDRFWEARKLWGSLLNCNRSLARQVITLPRTSSEKAESTGFINLLVSCTYALKHQLRGTNAENDLKKRLSDTQFSLIHTTRYKPIMMIKLMGDWIAHAHSKAHIDSIQQMRLDENLDKLAEIVGGCERIISTPIPYSYRVLLHRTVYLYCFLLPFGLVDSLQWLTPFIVVFIAYTFVAFEAIADEIEQPFGTAPNDLALNEMCQMIEATLMELDGKEIPEIKARKSGTID